MAQFCKFRNRYRTEITGFHISDARFEYIIFFFSSSFIEIIGYYHPIEKTDVLKIDEEKAIKWLQNGAQPTDTVKSLFTELGINQKFEALKKEAKSAK